MLDSRYTARPNHLHHPTHTRALHAAPSAAAMMLSSVQLSAPSGEHESSHRRRPRLFPAAHPFLVPLWESPLGAARLHFPFPPSDSLLYRPFPALPSPSATTPSVRSIFHPSRQLNRPVHPRATPSPRLPCPSRRSTSTCTSTSTSTCTCTCTCAIASPSVLATMYPRLCNCPIRQPAHGVAPIQPHRTSADMKPGQPKHSHGQSARPFPSGSPFAADQDPRGAYAYPSCYSQGHLAHPEPTDSLRPAALQNTIPTFTTRLIARPCLIPPQSPNPPLSTAYLAAQPPQSPAALSVFRNYSTLPSVRA
jgi:hypothetical protein